jgi:hypothetical protein
LLLLPPPLPPLVSCDIHNLTYYVMNNESNKMSLDLCLITYIRLLCKVYITALYTWSNIDPVTSCWTCYSSPDYRCTETHPSKLTYNVIIVSTYILVYNLNKIASDVLWQSTQTLPRCSLLQNFVPHEGVMSFLPITKVWPYESIFMKLTNV